MYSIFPPLYVLGERMSSHRSTLSYFCSMIYLGDNVQTYIAHTMCCIVFHSMEMPCFSNCPVNGNLYGFRPSPFPFFYYK